MNKPVFLLLLLLFSASCNDDECIQVPGAENLLPLQVSNYWIMEAKGYPSKITRRIDKKVTISGVEYFRMVREIQEDPAEVRRDTVYYRIGDEGFIYYKSSISSTETENLRPYACDGERWSFFEGSMTMHIQDYYFEDADTTISNCARYYYSGPGTDDSETVILAPRIGYLYQDASFSSLETTEAHVNGVTYTFK